jgi:hypothetical protein
MELTQAPDLLQTGVALPRMFVQAVYLRGYHASRCLRPIHIGSHIYCAYTLRLEAYIVSDRCTEVSGVSRHKKGRYSAPSEVAF